MQITLPASFFVADDSAITVWGLIVTTLAWQAAGQILEQFLRWLFIFRDKITKEQTRSFVGAREKDMTRDRRD